MIEIRIEGEEECYTASIGAHLVVNSTEADALYSLLVDADLLEVVEPYVENTSFADGLLDAILGAPTSLVRLDGGVDHLNNQTGCDYPGSDTFKVVVGQTPDGTWAASVRGYSSRSYGNNCARAVHNLLMEHAHSELRAPDGSHWNENRHGRLVGLVHIVVQA
ncbi:MAG: hypothetical protein C5B53_09525 [Candidatus Melainabacteria bacterium]|nr:MAG: hypothetical protein C5B53_09525 [Candidatus Melainabacteria bacterium]